MAKMDGRVAGRWMATFLGILFLGIGGGIGVWSSHTLLRAQAMQSWDEVPARIEECGLEHHRNSGGGRRGGGGTTYKVSATYSYTTGGQAYTGQRVTLHGGSDNVGSFQHRVYETLREAQRSGRALPCRVNPTDPHDAILFWTPRPDLVMFNLVFVIGFFGGGLLSLFAAFSIGPKLKDGRIRMEEAKSLLLTVPPAVAISLYVPWTLWLKIQTIGFGGLPWWCYLPLLLVATLITVSVYLWIRLKKFGVSLLELSPCPAKAGQPLRVIIHIPCRLDSEVHATFRCVHQYSTGSGKRRTIHKENVWQEVKRLALYTAGENETQARGSFDIRNHPATAGRGHDGYWWELVLKSEVPGVNYKATFEVPVEE